ncbi:hypothetical protein ANO11243_054060 [Dothideomycetidae sp. 11243]|nr:hypothetical protein ANO11243_054060 [fungal sp. No.11243]
MSETIDRLPSVPVLRSSRPADIKIDQSSILHANWLETIQDTSFQHHGHPVADFAHSAFPVAESVADGQLSIITHDKYSNGDLSEIELDVRARDLFKAFLACPKFLKYRSGTKKADKDVWSDHVEWAFFRDVKKWHQKQRKMGLPMYPVSWEGIHSNGTGNSSSLVDLESRRLGYGCKGRSSQPWLLQEFEMSLCTRNDATGELGQPLHTYCSSSTQSRLGDVLIDGRLNCFEVLPELFLNSHPRPIGGQVIALEASIELPISPRTSGKSELAIYLSLQGPRVAGPPVVDTVTTFYQACSEIEKQERLGSSVEDVGSNDPFTTCYQIPFCSSFWAGTLSRLGTALQRATDMTTSAYYQAATEDVRAQMQIEAATITQRIAEELRALTAVQQVTIYSQTNPTVKHHFTLRWQFKSTPAAAKGHVAWRLVSLPDDDISPLPSPTESMQSDPLSQGPGRHSFEPHTPDILTPNNPFDIEHQHHLQSPITLKAHQHLPVPEAQWITRYEHHDDPQCYFVNDGSALHQSQVTTYQDPYHEPDFHPQQHEVEFDFVAATDMHAAQQHVFVADHGVPVDPRLVPVDDAAHWQTAQTGVGQIDPWLGQGGFHGEFYAGHQQ